MTITARRIKDLLGKRGWDETTLAKVSKLNQPTVHRISSGESKSPKIASLKAIAKALNVSVAYLTGEDDQVINEPSPTYSTMSKSAAKLIKKIEELSETGMEDEDFALTLKFIERISKS